MVIALHIALLVQAPEKSGWLPYLRLLPKKFDTMPVRYPQELFDLLPQNAQGIVSMDVERSQGRSMMMSYIANIDPFVSVSSTRQQAKGKDCRRLQLCDRFSEGKVFV